MRVRQNQLHSIRMHVSWKRPNIRILRALTIIIMGLLCIGCSQDVGTDPQEPGTSLKATLTAAETAARELNPGEFSIKAKYDHILSYPTGGGVFLIKLVPDNGFTGNVTLSLAADVHLNAELDRNILNRDHPLAEITVHPSSSVAIMTHIIEVKASKGNITEFVHLEVEVINWPGGFSGEAVQKRDEFIDWLHQEHPEFGNFSGRHWFTYATYPGILVVEHWTFLDADWEMRICWHVMIPPYDWSKILLRRRGEWDPVFAAHHDTYGNIYEIPVWEYPTFGY